MCDASIPGTWGRLAKPHPERSPQEGQGDPESQRQQSDCGGQDGQIEDTGRVNSRWKHHGQEGDHQAQVDEEELFDAHQGQENYKSPKGGNLRSHSNPNLTKRTSVANIENHMNHMMKMNNEEMTKRMDNHNHMTKHMMKKDGAKKVEKKGRKKTKSKRVPLLMGLGLPVLRKRFLNSFQVSGKMMIRIRMMMTTMTLMRMMIRTIGRNMRAGELTRDRMKQLLHQTWTNIWILNNLSLQRITLSHPTRRNGGLAVRRREAGLFCKSPL
jgi:hypothetical protein